MGLFPINEKYFKSQDDIYINFDKWGKESNLLLITGLSGAGKTTLMNELIKKYDCEVISFDHFTASVINNKKYNKIIDKYINQNDDIHISDWKTDDEKYECRRFYFWLLEETKKNPNKLYILEGFQIYLFFDGYELKDMPIIIKGTSALQSWIRKNKRLLSNNKYSIIKRIDLFFKVLKELTSGSKFRDDDKLTDFKDELIQEDNTSTIKTSYGTYVDITISNKKVTNTKGYTYMITFNGISTTTYNGVPIYSEQRKIGTNIGNRLNSIESKFGKLYGDRTFTPKNGESEDEAIRKLIIGFLTTKKVIFGQYYTHYKEKNKDIIECIKQDKNADRYDLFIFRFEDRLYSNMDLIFKGNLKTMLKKYNIGFKEYKKPIKESIIQESSKVHIKTKKKYKCPFCDERYDREHLVYHIERKHPEMIPQDYTSARVVFNYINKKDHGSCVVCGGETEWKEENWKYARLCKNPKCKEASSKKADENCKKKTGKTPRELLLDSEHQNRMLKGRRISGVYTFQDGGKRDYVGSYEKNILEFYDKFLNKKSDEIQTPGPVIEYIYKGEKHFWITDIYDITANLAIDVKDGGDNPNTREMKDYREKQIAKEKAITEQGQYNYLRLTNNNFEQLLQILFDLKTMMLDDTVKNHTISMINEYTALGGMNPVIGSSGNYIVNYGIGGVFTGQAYTNDKALSKIYKIEDGKVKRKNTKEFLQEYDYELHEYNDDKNIEIEEGMELNSFYELLTGNKYIDEAQLLNDDRFKKTYSFYEYLESTNEVIRNSLIQEFNEYVGSPTLCIENNISDNQNEKIKVLQNENGYFIKNMISGLRSGYYDNEEDIPLSIKEIIK